MRQGDWVRGQHDAHGRADTTGTPIFMSRVTTIGGTDDRQKTIFTLALLLVMAGWPRAATAQSTVTRLVSDLEGASGSTVGQIATTTSGRMKDWRPHTERPVAPVAPSLSGTRHPARVSGAHGDSAGQHRRHIPAPVASTVSQSRLGRARHRPGGSGRWDRVLQYAAWKDR
jgi:hypothetical protein